MQNPNFLQSSQYDLLATTVVTAGAELNDTHPARRISNLNCAPNLFLCPHPIQVCCAITACNVLLWKRRESYRETGWGGRMPCSSCLWLIRKCILCFRPCFYPLFFPSCSFNRLRPCATQLSFSCSGLSVIPAENSFHRPTSPSGKSFLFRRCNPITERTIKILQNPFD